MTTLHRPDTRQLVPAYAFDRWDPVAGPQARIVLDILQGDAPVGLTVATPLWRHQPAFYPGWTLWRAISSEAGHPAHERHCLIGPDGLCVVLDGSSTLIHRMNASGALVLNAEAVCDYLKFFCFYVRGAHGPFHLLEQAADPLVPEAAWLHMSDDGLFLEEVLEPVTVRDGDATQGWQLHGLVYYDDACFRARFKVEPDGRIEMLDDKPMITDLPATLTTPRLV